jgi:hypothetical protein
MPKIILKAENIDETRLGHFIEALEESMEVTIKWSQVFELEMDDPKAAAILQTVFGGNEHAKAEEKPGRKAKVQDGRKKIGQRPRDWTVLTGEQKGATFASQGLARIVKAGKLDGAVLNHSQKGQFEVLHRQLVPVGKASTVSIESPESVAVPA